MIITNSNSTRHIDFSAMTPAIWDQTIEMELNSFRQRMTEIIDDPAPPTFATTLLAAEKVGLNLSDAWGALSCASAHATPEILDVLEKWSPLLSEAFSEIYQNEAWFSKIKMAYACEAEKWNASQIKLYQDTLKAFERSGAGKPLEIKKQIRELTSELARLDGQFERVNLQNAQNTIKVNIRDLAGGDESLWSGCAISDDNGERVVALPVSTPYMEPLISQVHDRAVRARLFEAWSSRGKGVLPGDQNTDELIQQTLHARHRLATLLGYASWADQKLSDQMAKTPQTVMDLLQSTWDKLIPGVTRDLQELEEFARNQGFNGERLQAFDVPYYAEKLRAERFNIDQKSVREYFPLSHVRARAFEVASRLFGVTFEKDPSLTVYHDDVVGYRVNKNGSPLGVILIDDYTRPTKQSGAWMNQFATGHRLGEGNGAGVINVLNIPKSSADPLLDFDDVITIFHELGHAMHGLLGQTTYPSQAGTSVARDFVELPSQILENWARTPKGLQELTKHHQTGLTMPDQMLKSLLASKTFGQGFFQTTYLQSAWADMLIHSQAPTDRPAVEMQDEALAALQGLPEALPARHHLNHFSHIFSGGYSAGYYSYLWAEVLEADAFTRFENDLFDQSAAHDLTELFTKGGSLPAMEVFLAYQGREPDPSAALKKWGLVDPAQAPNASAKIKVG